MGDEAFDARWDRWHACGWCEQNYHGVVSCALGWACWKTYVGRPETDDVRCMAMTCLGLGLSHAGHHEDALPVKEAQLSMMLRVGASGERIFVVQGNLANTYKMVGRLEEALNLRRDVHFGYVKLLGDEHQSTLVMANNYASSLIHLKCFEEAKSLLRKILPVGRRVFGESNELTLRMKAIYAKTLCENNDATLNDLREAVETLEDAVRIAQRVFGKLHPGTKTVERDLRTARATLRAREMLLSSKRISKRPTTKISNLHVQQNPHLFRRMHQEVRLAVAARVFVGGQRVDGRVRVREDLGT